jgi:hypothetical protein
MHEAGDVEDQRDLAGAEDGEAADAFHAVEDESERPDDRLVFAHQRIDDQPGAASGVVHDDDVFALDRLQQEGEFLVDRAA